METMSDTKSIKELAGEAAGYFTTTTRTSTDEKIVTLKDERPEWVYELVRSAHGDDFLPDDWRYESIRNALSFIEDTAEGEDLEDGHEFADQNVDTYTAERLNWLASNLNRQSYVDRAVAEFGIERGENDGIADQIGMGQYMESMEVYGLVIEALTERADEVEA